MVLNEQATTTLRSQRSTTPLIAQGGGHRPDCTSVPAQPGGGKPPHVGTPSRPGPPTRSPISGGALVKRQK